jgi:hypothetical protein
MFNAQSDSGSWLLRTPMLTTLQKGAATIVIGRDSMWIRPVDIVTAVPARLGKPQP